MIKKKSADVFINLKLQNLKPYLLKIKYMFKVLQLYKVVLKNEYFVCTLKHFLKFFQTD